MKTIIHILGAGATGKSSLARAICGPDGVEYANTITVLTKAGDSVSERIKYTLFPNGYSIAGNLKNTSDSISSMNALRATVQLCLLQRDIVVVDPVRSSRIFVDWIQALEEPLRAVFVYLTLPLEENLRRLRERRISNGREPELSEKTLANVEAYRARAKFVWEYACKSYVRQPNYFVEIGEDCPIVHSSECIKMMMNTVLETL